jgi:two-component system cell cycle response regulator
MSARILVVDDILPNVKLLEAKLTSEYYDVLTATSGQEALDKVTRESPDIVLLDVMMPGMDGFEVCRRIKDSPEHAHIPVVMVTALTGAEDKVRGLEAGADDFLSKPINDTALMARVRSLVRLKMTMDEWRLRENTANQLGVMDRPADVMKESSEQAQILIIEDKGFEHKKMP